MTDNRSPKEIEREIERERAGLTNTLEDLQDRFSIDGVVRQIGDQLREHGGDIGASVSRAVKDNPMALALTGVGLAWMIFGNRDGDKADDRRHVAVRRMSNGTRLRQNHDDRAHGDARVGTAAYDSRPGRGRGMIAQNDMPSWMREYPGSADRRGQRATGGHAQGGGHSAATGSSSMAGSVSDAASAMAGTVSDKASDAAGAVAYAAGQAKDSLRDAGASAADLMRDARDTVSDMADHAADRVADLRNRLAEGTEALGDEARERVFAARERAMQARDAAGDYAKRGRDKAMDLFEDQPLIAGALAIAVGAAIGAALPRTRTEDRYFGEQSDELIDEAERIFAEERAKVTKVARAAVDEARDVMAEAKEVVQDTAAKVKADADRTAPADTAAQAVADKARQAGQRVVGAARDEADKQSLGTSLGSKSNT